MGHTAQKQHTVTGHHALNEWRHNVDKLNKAQNADAERVQKVTRNAVEIRRIESRSERIKQFQVTIRQGASIKNDKGVVHSNHQMAANLERSEEVDFAVKAES
ncbi:uncharacterized protein N7473_007219 [Penicillium subrubescens]|uniref:Uncharacterized protein n=1 Tax=Penicillium subrubescens TaxID=1316194 RepID=A0A1Q5UN61_9EURO|nr:uncharacterized protein N7473_007219 [Penicillium subrubescens]KAJ5890991.1 hypothetical protein N7473_007219 [Penicillium subrubescens]OKP13903.1 hypothetical protein PENSUB_478 [Penicillium subrubescens]